VRVDGERLDGIGVDPTIAVPFDPRYAAGSDPQLDRAIAVLSHD
jgi:carboxyl-terminal processing protease